MSVGMTGRRMTGRHRRTRTASMLHINIYITNCPGAPVALRHAASRHADRHYSQSRNLNSSRFVVKPEGGSAMYF